MVKVLLAVLSLFLLSNQALWAEDPPPGEEPGAQSTRFETSVEEKKKTFEEKKEKPAEIEIEKEEEKPSVETIAFVLKDIRITGATVFKDKEFRPIYKSYIGQRVTFKDLESIVTKIKIKYKQSGYLTAAVYIPAQDIKDGIVELRVVEGKLGNVSIEGNRHFSSTLINKYIHTKKNEALNFKTLQRDILRLNQNPDLEVKSVISPSEEPQASDLSLKIKDYFPHHAGVSFDNQGSRLVGKDKTLLTFRSTNITGKEDSLFGSLLLTRDANAQSVGYVLPIDTYGTKLGFNFSHFNMKLGREFKYLDITGDSKVYTTYIRKELSLSEDFQASLDVGIDMKSNKKHTDGVTTADDQMRIPYFGFDFVKTDGFGQTQFSPRFDFGTENFLGASSRNHPTTGRRETGGFFVKYEQVLTRVQSMFFESYCVIRSRAQAATHTLASSEQLQIGGANSVRGYPEGDFLADIGVILNLDWIFPAYIFPESIKLPHSDVPLRRQIEPLVFIDLGGGRLNKAMPNERRDKFLAGIGGGFRVRLYRNLYARFEWAKDIGSNPISGAGPSSFHLTVQTEI